MSPPTIRTDRLWLRAFARTDAADVFAYASNPNVARFTTWRPHGSLADSEAFLDMVLSAAADDHTWAICPVDETRVIGAIDLSRHGDTADVHYVLAEPEWNRGLMSEAVRAVLAWALDQWPEVQRIVSRAVAENAASLRVMARCGLEFQRVCEAKWPKLETPVRQHEYAANREALRRRLAEPYR